MAGEIGHVVYGARTLHYLDDKVQDEAFWLGTLFPDIRHLGVLSRHRTHPKDVSLSSLIGETDFSTGLRVHAWIDATREKFLRDRNIKEELPWHPFVPHALKLLEDEILYDHFNDWDEIKAMLNKVHKEEQIFIEDDSVLRRWHEVLQEYFQEKPNDETRQQLALSIGLSKNNAIEINLIVKQLRENKKTIEIIENFWHHLEDILA